MKSELREYIEFNPKESLSKGIMAKKIAMEALQPFQRDIRSFEVTPYNGGTKFRNGDTIMARITPCLENGKTSMVSLLDDNEVGFGSTEYIVLRAKPGMADPHFVYYLTRSDLVRDKAIQSMVGSSGRQRVQQSVVESILYDFPYLDDQRRIANLLKLIDDKIAINNAINDNLEKQAQALYQDMFSKYDGIEGSLGDIADITMGQSPCGNSYNEECEGEVFYQGRAEFGSRFPARRLYTTEPKRMACANDVLLSVRAPVGDLNVAYEKCCIGRGLGAIHSKDGNSSYLLYTMMSLKPQLNVFNGEGTVFGSINRAALNALPVMIPSHDRIEAFENIAHPMDQLIRSNYEEICRLQALRDSILPKLMSGEIDVSAIQI